VPRLPLALVCLCLAVGCGDGGPSTPTATPIVPPRGQPVTFVGAGDIALCGSPGTEATARLLDGIDGTVFTAGDNAYFHGNANDYARCYDPTWGRHRDRTRPSPGNHEYETPGAAAYFDYFGDLAGPPGRGYYSFRLGSWHIISLNSNIPTQAGSAQWLFLRSELAQNAVPCTLVYWHHALFSSGPNGNHRYMFDFWRALYDAGADVIVNGHDHSYERFAPQDPDGRLDTARGLRQFIVGTGGAEMTASLAPLPNSEVRLRAFGVLKFTLDEGAYEWSFLQANGQIGDFGSGRCH
jgi:hypothetical protein